MTAYRPTPTTLLRACGLAAIAAGGLFIVIQFIHPHEVAANVATTRWEVTHYLSMLMAVLALIGISGMYLRQVERTGGLGLLAYLLFAANFLAIFAWTFAEALILPLLVPAVPQFVNDVISIPGGGTVLGDVGGLKLVNAGAGIGYLLGGLLFGVAMYRGRILARWAALLLSIGTVATILIPLIPHWAARATAIPVGVALAGLGWSLWREQRTPSDLSAVDVETQPAPAGAR
jgi:hypothetical protein